jgi:hypothetical protein
LNSYVIQGVIDRPSSAAILAEASGLAATWAWRSVTLRVRSAFAAVRW